MRRLPLLVIAIVTLAADWPRFRGPNGSGIADAPAALLSVDAAKPLFSVKLPPGYGSPIIAGDTLFVQSSRADGKSRTLHALDAATGAEKWAKTTEAKSGHVHRKNSLSTGTPAVEGKRVFEIVFDGTDVTIYAYTLAGESVWHADLGPFKSQHGPGLSPVAYNGKVYVNLDQDGDARLMAFDAATGKIVWNSSRKAFRASYSAPVVRELDGKGEIVVASTAGISGYDPASGKMNWEWEWHFDGMALREVSAPVVSGEMVYAATGDGGGSRSMVGVRAGPSPKLVWEKRRDTPYVPSILAIGKHLYWVTDAGVAICAEAATGKIVWSERVFNGSVSASPIAAGDAILAFGEDGRGVTFRATPAGYEKISEAKLTRQLVATPAVAGGRLYVRAGGMLVCFGAK